MIKTVVSTSLPIEEKLLIRKNVMRGGEGKKRLCIVTGTHGDELEGQYVCVLLNRIIRGNPEALNGIVEIYPALNPLGIDSITRGIPNFDLDMNRIFPGDPDGSMAEATAFAVLHDLKGADLVIDIHSSNIFLREVTQVRINVNTAKTLLPYAKMLGIPFIWVHEAATVLEATLAHSLNSLSTPTLVVEMGVGMRINHSLGRQLSGGILALMREMGMWRGEEELPPRGEPIVSEGDSVAFVNAEESGIFLTELHNDTVVEAGDEIGEIADPLTGDTRLRVTAPCRGLLFTIRAYPVVYRGSLLARIHKM